MKVYIQFDFEGITGFVIRDNQDRNIPTVLDRTRRFMKIATAEVSAAADGAFAAGADEVLIWDSHGQGNTLLIEELSERATLITGEYEKGPWLPFFKGTDIGIYIGGHAMHGTPQATIPHTIMELNGKKYGEVGMFILECGSQGVPVVMVSGDSAVKNEVIHLIPDSEFVVTKIAAGPTLIKSITPSLSCKLIFDAVKKGIMSAGKIKPCRLDLPYTFVIPGKNESRHVYEKNDLLSAYRAFLKEYYAYNKGWPEYDLIKPDEAIDCL